MMVDISTFTYMSTDVAYMCIELQVTQVTASNYMIAELHTQFD